MLSESRRAVARNDDGEKTRGHDPVGQFASHVQIEGRVIDDTIKRCGDCGNLSVDSNGLTCGHTNVEYVKVQRREEHIAHPTVKPLDLMRWLVRLVTPKGGVVLDPFLGSGTTVEACVIEGFRCVGVERESDYLPLIRARLTKPIQPDLFG